jgi:hypothetical protein
MSIKTKIISPSIKFNLKNIFLLFFWLMSFSGLALADYITTDSNFWDGVEIELAKTNSGGKNYSDQCKVCLQTSSCINKWNCIVSDQDVISSEDFFCDFDLNEGNLFYEQPFYDLTNHWDHSCTTDNNFHNRVCSNSVNFQYFLDSDNKSNSTFLLLNEKIVNLDSDVEFKDGLSKTNLKSDCFPSFSTSAFNFCWLRMRVKSGYQVSFDQMTNILNAKKSFTPPTAKPIEDFKFFYHQKDSNNAWKEKFDNQSESSGEIEIEDTYFPNSDFSQKKTAAGDVNWKLKNSNCLEKSCEDELLRNGTFKVSFKVAFENQNDYPITFKNIKIPFVVKKTHVASFPLYKYEIESNGKKSSFWINDATDSKQELKKETVIENEYNGQGKECKKNGYFWKSDRDNSLIDGECSFVFNCKSQNSDSKIDCSKDVKYIAKINELDVAGGVTEEVEIQLYFVQESFWGEEYQFNGEEIVATGDYEYEDGSSSSKNGNFDFNHDIPKIILNNKPFNEFPNDQQDWWQAVGGGVYVENLSNLAPLETEKTKGGGTESLTNNNMLKNTSSPKYNIFSTCRYSLNSSLYTKNRQYYKGSCSPFLNANLKKYYKPGSSGPFGGLVMYKSGDVYQTKSIDAEEYSNRISERDGTCLASDSVCNDFDGSKIEDDQFSLKVTEELDVGTYQYYFNLAKTKNQDFYDLLNGSSSSYISSNGVPFGDAINKMNGCVFAEIPLIEGNDLQPNLLCYFGDVAIDSSSLWVVRDDYSITIFANSLTINGDTNNHDISPISINDGGYLGFFVKNNITINENVGASNRQTDECLKKGYPAFFSGADIAVINNGVADKICYSPDYLDDEVEHLDGVFFADGQLIINGETDVDKIDRKLNLKGIYVAKGGVKINRSYGDSFGKNIKHLHPLVRFIFNPDLNLTAPEWLKRSRKIYQEKN